MMNSEIANKIFSYDDGKLIWKLRPLEDFKTFGSFKTINTRNGGKVAGMTNGIGYIVVGYKSKLYLAHRIIWMLINGDLKDNEIIDHIDGNTENNKIENLRLSTKSTNAMNSKMPKNNKSGIKGVSWYEERKVWVAQVKSLTDKKSKHFKNKDDAIKWVNEQRDILHKEFTNFG